MLTSNYFHKKLNLQTHVTNNSEKHLTQKWLSVLLKVFHHAWNPLHLLLDPKLEISTAFAYMLLLLSSLSTCCLPYFLGATKYDNSANSTLFPWYLIAQSKKVKERTTPNSVLFWRKSIGNSYSIHPPIRQPSVVLHQSGHCHHPYD